jgi:hypothetical protein
MLERDELLLPFLSEKLEAPGGLSSTVDLVG